MKAHIFDKHGNYVATYETNKDNPVIRLPKLENFDDYLEYRLARQREDEKVIQLCEVIEYRRVAFLRNGSAIFEEKWY